MYIPDNIYQGLIQDSSMYTLFNTKRDTIRLTIPDWGTEVTTRNWVTVASPVTPILLEYPTYKKFYPINKCNQFLYNGVALTEQMLCDLCTLRSLAEIPKSVQDICGKYLNVNITTQPLGSILTLVDSIVVQRSEKQKLGIYIPKGVEFDNCTQNVGGVFVTCKPCCNTDSTIQYDVYNKVIPDINTIEIKTTEDFLADISNIGIKQILLVAEENLREYFRIRMGCTF